MLNLITKIFIVFMLGLLLTIWIDRKTYHWPAWWRVLLGLGTGAIGASIIVWMVAREFFPAVF